MLVQSWVGADYAEIVAKHGEPKQVKYLDDGSREFTFFYRRDIPSGRVSTTYGRSGPITTYVPGPPETKWCWITFNVGPNARVVWMKAEMFFCRYSDLARYDRQIPDRPRFIQNFFD